MKKKKSQTNMTIFLQKSWAFLRQYWAYILAFTGGLVGFLLLRGDRNNLLKQLQDIREAHEIELAKINAAREEERKKNKEALEKLQKTLSDIQRQYDEAKIELDKKKKKEIEDLVSRYGDDPNVLAEKLSAATGFKVILPE